MALVVAIARDRRSLQMLCQVNAEFLIVRSIASPCCAHTESGAAIAVGRRRYKALWQKIERVEQR